MKFNKPDSPKIGSKISPWLLSTFSGLLFVYGQNVFAASSHYLIRKGDILSRVVHENVPGPIWGEEGSIHKVLVINPQIKNPDLIYPGDYVLLPNLNPKDEISSDEPAVAPSLSKPAKSPLMEISAITSMSNLTFRDKSTNSKSILASNMYAAVKADWFQRLNSRQSGFFRIKLAWISFQPPGDQTKKLSPEADGPLLGMGAGLKFNLLPKLTFKALGEYGQELFARQISISETTVDRVAVPSIGAEFSWEAFSTSDYAMGILGHYKYFFAAKAASIDAGNGASQGAGFYLKRISPFHDGHFKGEVKYQTRNQDTDLIEQTQSDLVFGLKLSF